MKVEKVLCSAIWYNDHQEHPQQAIYGITEGFVLCGYRHCNIIAILPTNPFASSGIVIDCNYTQGFITTKGRFVTREEAYKIVTSTGQATPMLEGTLYSEDLY